MSKNDPDRSENEPTPTSSTIARNPVSDASEEKEDKHALV